LRACGSEDQQHAKSLNKNFANHDVSIFLRYKLTVTFSSAYLYHYIS
jgi:hypothetical protein